jgi:sulfite reductase alpha subunit-like flavoprotein
VSEQKVDADLKMKYEPPIEQEAPVLCSQIKSHLNEETPTDLDLPPLQNITVPDAYLVQLVSNKRVTPESHWQDVRELNFILPSGCNYEPGDTMTIYPKNFPQDVQALIDLQDWNDVADKPLRFAPRQPDYFLDEDLMELVPPGLYLTPRSTLRDLLTLNLDITAIPKRFFFQAIAHHTDDATHKERLLEFTNPAFTDEFYDYTT